MDLLAWETNQKTVVVETGNQWGDFGDPDFQQAIILSKRMGKVVPLVAFGHMHHTLRHTKEKFRTIVNIDQEGTVYLNAAVTPASRRESINFLWCTLSMAK